MSDEAGRRADAGPVGLGREGYAARMNRVARDAGAAGFAGLLVTPGPDLEWLCGYRPTGGTERLTLLVLAPDTEPHLLVPVEERAEARAARGARAVRITEWRDGQDPYAVAAGLLRADGRYGVSDSAWALHLLGLQEALPLTTYRALGTALPMLRAVKDAHEVARLAAAGAAADAVYEEILAVRFAGRRESDVAADLALLLLAHGHSAVTHTVVASGPHSADPRRHPAGARVIEDGDMVVLGFTGLRDGYGSVLARTVHVGPPTEEERAVHEIVRTAQEAAVEAARPGVPCREIDRVARAVIAGAGHGDHVPSPATGHGIGVTLHEPPYLTAAEEQPLLPGMCFTVGPGIHLPGRFGVRIEDVVTCTQEGVRRLTLAAREMAVVG
jgi:Xaa-Pro aminopeptidase